LWAKNAALKSSLSSQAWVIGVAMKPGAMALMRMPRAEYSGRCLGQAHHGVLGGHIVRHVGIGDQARNRRGIDDGPPPTRRKWRICACMA
jgi:hypothetical protein